MIFDPLLAGRRSRHRFTEPGGKYQFAPHFGQTLMELNNAPDVSLSDHAYHGRSSSD